MIRAPDPGSLVWVVCEEWREDLVRKHCEGGREGAGEGTETACYGKLRQQGDTQSRGEHTKVGEEGEGSVQACEP